MKKMVFYLIFGFGVFYFGTLWNDSVEEKTEMKTETKKVFPYILKDDMDRNNYVLYELSEKTLKNNQLKEEIEGSYDVYVEMENGKKSEIFDGSREIIKNGEKYLLKVKALYSENYVWDEWRVLKIIENELNMKLILSKKDKV